MKKHFPLLLLAIVLFHLTSAVQVSARAEVPGGMLELRRDGAATSGLRPSEGAGSVSIQPINEGDQDRPDANPVLYTLPNEGDEDQMRRGVPAQVEQRLPLQVLETRQARSEERVVREERLSSMNKPERVLERSNDVSKSIEKLLSNPNREGEVGEEVRQIARQHQETQLDLEENLKNVNTRNMFLKFFTGSDKSTLNQLKEEGSQIDGRITKLKLLSNSVEDLEEKAQLDNLIEDLEGQRNDLLETVSTEESSFSITGWMRRLFGQK